MALEDVHRAALIRQTPMGHLEIAAKGGELAASSLKKMGGSRGMEEGIYASADRHKLVNLTSGDLGLTLLPGLQVQRAYDNIPPELTHCSLPTNTQEEHTRSNSFQTEPSKSVKRALKRSWSRPFPTIKAPSSSQRYQAPASYPSRSSHTARHHAKTGQKPHTSSKRVLNTARNLLQTYSEPTTRDSTIESDMTYAYDMSPAMGSHQMFGVGDWTAGLANAPFLDSYADDASPAENPFGTLGVDRETINDVASPSVNPFQVPGAGEETLDVFAERVFGEDELVQTQEVQSEEKKSEEMDQDQAWAQEDWQSWMPADLSIELGF